MIIAVDPGINGSLTVIKYDLSIELCVDLPVLESRGVRTLDFEKTLSIIKPFQLTLGIIEDVSSAPEQGVASTFKFGYASGFLYGLLLAHCPMVKRIKPSVWKSVLGLTSDKRKSIVKANEIFPGTTHFKKVKDHNKAEAALLGYVAYKMFQK